MIGWAYVENGQVVELYHSLPINWKNVSNFFALENDTVSLRNLGWYPVQNNTLELQKNQQYGETTYFFDKRKKIVIENTLIVDRPLEDPKILKYNFDKFIGTAKKVYERRELKLDKKEISILKYLNEHH